MVLNNITVAGNSSVITGFGQQFNVNRVQQPIIPTAPVTSAGNSLETQSDETQRESVRVSSSIGRAATAGQLSRQEAVDIYRQIASLL
jgi:hypothetical protein